jgi:hypothetical protein
MLTLITEVFKQKKTAFVRLWPAATERQNHAIRLSMSHAFVYLQHEMFKRHFVKLSFRNIGYF